MAETKLNTRLQLKYDSFEAWYESTIILKAGEVAIATVANNTANANGTKFTNLPNVVIKVGDGVNLYKDLPFVSALAADVHGWAKEATKPTYIAGDFPWLEQYIKDTANAEIQDTDTQYTLVAVDADNHKYELRSKSLSDAGWTKVADLDLSGIVADIAALKGLVGEKKVSEQIAEAIEAIDVAGETAGQGEIISAVSQDGGAVVVAKRALVKEDIPTIDKSQVDGLETALENAAKAGTDAAAQALEDAQDYADEAVQNAIDGINYTDPTYVEGQFVTKVTQTKTGIEVQRAAVGIANVTGLQTKLDEMDTAIAGKQEQLTFVGEGGLVVTPGTEEGKRVATEAYVTEAVADLNGAMHFRGRYETLPEAVDQFDAGDVIIIPAEDDENAMIEYVLDNNKVWQKLGHESIYQLKADATTQHNALQQAIEDGLAELDEAKQDNVNFKSAYSAENPVMTEDDVDTAIAGAIDAINVAGETAGQGEIIETVKQEKGGLVVTKRALNAADIPMIEQSQVNGLEQALEDVEAAGQAAADQALADAKADAASQIETAVTGLAKADDAVEKNVVTAVSQEQGIISVTRAPLSDIAWSGNVKDLKQDEGDVLVFYCGTATEVI